MNIDIMINNIILHNKLSCVYEKMQHCKGVKIQKKIKKIGRGRMFTDVLAEGGWGIPATHCNARLVRCGWLR